jgi:hypothetical protein
MRPGAFRIEPLRARGHLTDRRRAPSGRRIGDEQRLQIMNVTRFPATRPGSVDLAELLGELGVGKDSQIQISGPDGLGALLWLCRRGYEHAAYVKCGRPCRSEVADALIAPHAMAMEDLARLLDCGPRVRPGGALVIQVRADAPGGETAVQALLEQSGYSIERRFDRGVRRLVAARRTSAPYARAA